MNKSTLEIAEYIATHFASCTLQYARTIQTRMEENGLDLSECSKSQFNRAIVTAYCEVQS
jgi:hypothetical protein